MPQSNGPDAARTLLRVGLPLVVILFAGWWLTSRQPPTRTQVVTPSASFETAQEPDSASWDSLPSELVLVGAKEPGTPLVIYGHVYGGDGQPASGERMFVYHADARGEYGTSTKNSGWVRLSGQLKTDSLGRYRIRTVKPGSSAGAAHVHFMIGGGVWKSQHAFELRFADDPANRVGGVLPGFTPDTGLFATVRAAVRDPGGVLRVRRDFRLQ